MKSGVSKLEFIKSLEETLKLTRLDIEKLLLKDNDTVTIVFRGGHTKDVNIALNSGLAIIEDIVLKLYWFKQVLDKKLKRRLIKVERIYLNFSDLNGDAQDYLLERSVESIDPIKIEELKDISDDSGIEYEELLRTQAEKNLYCLDIEFNI